MVSYLIHTYVNGCLNLTRNFVPTWVIKIPYVCIEAATVAP